MNTTIKRNSSVNGSGASRIGKEFSRILTAAVINSQFRQMLLTNPGKAVEVGYGGESFHLAREDKNCIGAIHATSLADFASQLNRTLEVNRAASSYAVGD
jgi:hypothetical protein